MSNILVELAAVAFTISIIYKFKLHQKFIAAILKNITIYLPPTDTDFEKICDLKKGKIQNPNGNTLIRTISAEEYFSKIIVEQSTEIELITLFFISSFTNMTFQLIYKIANYYFQFHQISNENLNEVNPFNVVASYSFISLFYMLFVLSKPIFKNGYMNYESKIFLIIVFISASLILSILKNFDFIFNVKSQDICEILNGKFQLIMAHTNNLSDNTLILCDSNVLNILFSFTFSFTLALIYRSSIRHSTLDYYLSETCLKTNESNVETTFSKLINNIPLIIKIKYLMSALIFMLLVDPLLKDYLVKKLIISQQTFYLIFIFPLILIDLSINLYNIKYNFLIFLKQNFNCMVDFSNNPIRNNLKTLRDKMDYINHKFWEIFMQLFDKILISLFSFFFLIHRSNIFESKIDDKEFEFKSNFVETLTFFTFFAIRAAEFIFQSCNLFYLRHYQANKKIMFI